MADSQQAGSSSGQWTIAWEKSKFDPNPRPQEDEAPDTAPVATFHQPLPLERATIFEEATTFVIHKNGEDTIFELGKCEHIQVKFFYKYRCCEPEPKSGEEIRWRSKLTHMDRLGRCAAYDIYLGTAEAATPPKIIPLQRWNKFDTYVTHAQEREMMKPEDDSRSPYDNFSPILVEGANEDRMEILPGRFLRSCTVKSENPKPCEIHFNRQTTTIDRGGPANFFTLLHEAPQTYLFCPMEAYTGYPLKSLIEAKRKEERMKKEKKKKKLTGAAAEEDECSVTYDLMGPIVAPGQEEAPVRNRCDCGRQHSKRFPLLYGPPDKMKKEEQPS